MASLVRVAAITASRCENGVSDGVIVFDEVALRREAIQETLLVLDAALSQHIGAWVVVQRRRLELPECDGSPQAREVAAADMSAEVGGRERELAIGVAHGAGR